MIGKLCSAPKGGGSAGGLVEYLVGYSVADKGATKEQIQDALDRVFVEAEARPDLGVGEMWSPAAGGGTRPSSILVRNCASFSTASLEIDADAARNPGVRTGAMHFVWSWNEVESGRLTDDQAHQYVGEVMGKLGLGGHRSVAVVHRDTDNLHVHIAVGAVDPRTNLAYDRTGLHRRMAWAERECERDHDLDTDRGLAMLRNAHTPHAVVEWADKHELAAWRAERKEERLVRLERRSHAGYIARDTTFQRYADATVAPRLRVAMDLAKERDRDPDWATQHVVAARYGCALQRDEEGRVVLRDVGTGEMRLEHSQTRRAERSKLAAQGIDRDEIDERIATLRSEHDRAEAEERELKTKTGDVVALDDVLRADRTCLGEFRDPDQAERQIVERVEADPGLVLRDVTAQTSTFTREDLDLWLGSRISDPTEIERLGDLVMRHESVRMLSADTMHPLMTTTEVLAVEDRLADDARALAQTPSGITVADVERAIETYETQQSVGRETPFRLSGEQREALQGLAGGSLASTEGLPGTGKTTVMGCVRVLGEQTSREVVGVTLSQAAAERLESEAGFRCVNTARAKLLEERGERVVPSGGIVVVDEAAMMDSRANGRILALARERGSAVQEIYDLRQLQPIDFGSSARIIRDVAREIDTHSELRDVQRQSRDWHRQAVVRMADAIVERDDDQRKALVREALGILDDHGAITWADTRDEAIDEAVHRVREQRDGARDVILIASDKDSVRHLAEEDRRRSGLEGVGRSYDTDGGMREFAVGDRLMFLQNSLGKRGMGVRNGDRGVVVAIEADRIDVRFDDGRTVVVQPSAYSAIDHGNASTVHKAQGASVDACVALIDRSASAELVFVAVSRSKHALDVVVPATAFSTLDELAEHVADRISLKTTTRHWDELLDRTGGPDTIRVLNIEAQREAAPLRIHFDQSEVEPVRALREERVAELRQAYLHRKDDVAADPTLTMAERRDAERAALREMRSEAAKAYREIKPMDFGIWLDEREQARDRARAAEELRADRDRTQDREQEHDQTPRQEREQPRRRDGAFARAERQAQQEREHDHDR